MKLLGSERTEENLVVLLFPRFKNKYLQRIFVFRNKSPFIKINLDNFGSAFWEECDGKRDVHKIGISLKEKFGDSIEPVYKRLQVFITQLRKNGFIELIDKNNQ